MIDPIDLKAVNEAVKDGGFFDDKGHWYSLYRDSGTQKLYRKRVETIVFRNNNKEIFLKKSPSGDYRFPGGSVEPNISDKEQASNECNEEAHIKIDNIMDPKVTYMKKYENGQKFKTICSKFKGNTGYDGAFTIVYVADFAGKFNGHIDEEDEDPFIRSGRWYSVKDALKFLSKEHILAVKYYLDTHPLKEEAITESYITNYFRNKKFLKDVSGSPEVGKEACEQIIAGLTKSYKKLSATSAIKKERMKADVNEIFHPVYTFEFPDGCVITIGLTFDDKTSNPGSAYKSEKYGYMVIIYPCYFNEPQESQKFILLHEIGHIRLQHVEWKHASKTLFGKDKYLQNRSNAIKKGKVIYPEYNADLYAVLNGSSLFAIMDSNMKADFGPGGEDYRFTNQELASRHNIVWKKYQKLRPFGESRISSYDLACMAVYETVYDNEKTESLSDSDKKKLYQILFERCFNIKLKAHNIRTEDDREACFEKYFKESFDNIGYNINDEASAASAEKSMYKKYIYTEAHKILDRVMIDNIIEESPNSIIAEAGRLISYLF